MRGRVHIYKKKSNYGMVFFIIFNRKETSCLSKNVLFFDDIKVEYKGIFIPIP